MNKKPVVYVGMSGGVDSSLSAALLKEQDYKVVGVYMKNWSKDLPGMKCPWAEDLADAKRVAVKLGIDFKVFDFEKEYKQKVVDYMIDEYKKGRTPNPDIMCNQEVKFKLFLEAALEDGADMIATGHYARVYSASGTSATALSELLHAGQNKGPSALFSSGSRGSDNTIAELPYEGILPDVSVNERGVLLKAVDENKDQTYFLYRITSEALGRTLFPIGEFTKPQVRQMAKERGLSTAAKKDSQGICFVGQIGIREFLSQYVEQKPGDVIDKVTGKVIGCHDGAIFYTIGQRHGLDIGGGLPYYVVGKDMEKNEVYVTANINDDNLWKKAITLQNLHWINGVPKDGEYQIRMRHRAPLIKARLQIKDDEVFLTLDDAEKITASGQSVVVYDGETCLGGGIVK